MKPAPFLLPVVAAMLVASGCDSPETGSNAAPVSPDTLAALEAELEAVRKTRDALQHDLDVMTRERVDVDGEVTRLKQELEALKAQLDSTGTPSPAR